jgi:hypothetical protein
MSVFSLLLQLSAASQSESTGNASEKLTPGMLGNALTGTEMNLAQINKKKESQ